MRLVSTLDASFSFLPPFFLPSTHYPTSSLLTKRQPTFSSSCRTPGTLSVRGPLGWLVPSEIQPLETRAAGTGINTLVNFLFTFLIGQIFLVSSCFAPGDFQA